jgi:outer membrane protein OmpA-like peptidoglycan-associated protein
MVPQSMSVPSLSSSAYVATTAGAVIRVFYPFARTEFEPSEQVAQALRTSARDAESIEVRGYTDGNVPNVADRRIAIQRADRARAWLVSIGVDPSKVHTRYFTAGNFLAENETAAGRSMNRRVEIDVHSQALLGSRIATTTR